MYNVMVYHFYNLLPLILQRINKTHTYKVLNHYKHSVVYIDNKKKIQSKLTKCTQQVPTIFEI